MEFLICGTSAAEGIPALFCTCAVCQEARQLGGKNVRSRAAYQISEKIRIDFGPDSHWHSHRYGLAFERLEVLLQTHSHADHLHAIDLQYRRKGFSVIPPGTTLTIWGNDAVERTLKETLSDDLSPYFMAFCPVIPWQPICLPDDMEAIPIPAMHDPNELCVNYIVRKGEKAVLFGHDTGWYSEETWERLQDFTLDCVLFDCTYCCQDHERNHMGGMALVRGRDQLVKQGTLAASGQCIATHFSHNGGALYDTLDKFFAPHGIQVAYDGMKVMLSSKG